MKLSFVILLSLFFFGCGKQKQQVQAKAARIGGASQLSSEDRALLRSINSAHADLLDFTASLASPTHAASKSARVLEAAKAFDSTSCSGSTWTEPSSSFEKDWDATQLTTASSSCPVHYSRHVVYRKDQHHLLIDSELKVKRNNLGGVGDLTEVITKGDLNLIAERRGGTAVGGSVQVKMHLNSTGDVKVDIRTATRSSSARTESAVDALIVPADHRVRIARVRWSSRNPDQREYFVNNVRLDSDTFKELFSALGLDEYMDNSLKMR